MENALSTGTSNEYTAEGKTTSIRARDKNTPMGPPPKYLCCYEDHHHQHHQSKIIIIIIIVKTRKGSKKDERSI
jgi:hypothetical protein